MLIDWPSRRMQIEHEGFTVVLQGVISNASKCETLNSVQLASMEKQAAVAYAIHICFATDSDTITELNCIEVPPEIVQVLLDYQDIFLEPTGLPQKRACNHTIPLMQGAQPVNIRGYRHKPELKMEVERQVAEMLKAALIQKSSIPFSSPIILVKKKDGTWRMCVDYRCLNAMTIISKYPVPVLEDILDELSGARWFSKLDLRSGYH